MFSSFLSHAIFFIPVSGWKLVVIIRTITLHIFRLPLKIEASEPSDLCNARCPPSLLRNRCVILTSKLAYSKTPEKRRRSGRRIRWDPGGVGNIFLEGGRSSSPVANGMVASLSSSSRPSSSWQFPLGVCFGQTFSFRMHLRRGICIAKLQHLLQPLPERRSLHKVRHRNRRRIEGKEARPGLGPNLGLRPHPSPNPRPNPQWHLDHVICSAQWQLPQFPVGHKLK